MANLTLSIDSETVKRVRRIALENDTTLTAMVRQYLEQLAARDDESRHHAVDDLRKSFQSLSKPFGKRDWTRDDLYERSSVFRYQRAVLFL